MTTSAKHPNAGRIRDVYTKWFDGVISPMMQLLADDVVYHLPGKHLGGGDVHGREALLARGREHAASYDVPPRVDILDVVANDVFGITYERFRATRLGRMLDTTICGVWRFERGRCVELWAHVADQPACDAFWS